MGDRTKREHQFDALARNLSEAEQEYLHALAKRTAELAQQNVVDNDQIDTAFMRDNVHALAPGGPGLPPVSEMRPTRANANGVHRLEQREADAVPGMPEDRAGVVAAANYSLHQELREPFLGAAVDQVTKEADGIVVKAARKRGV